MSRYAGSIENDHRFEFRSDALSNTEIAEPENYYETFRDNSSSISKRGV